MSDDPETLRQIEELARDDRPLLVLDVDDVVLDFVQVLPRYLETNGFELRFDSFRLHGNIYDLATGTAAERERVSELIDVFFGSQADWQTVTEGAAEAMAQIAKGAEVVLLTAMPHRHRATRRRHLDALGLPYPLLTTEMAKGPAILRLRGDTKRPVAFVDDLPPNLISAQQSVADAHLFHMVADDKLRSLLPPLPTGIIPIKSWSEAMPKISGALGI